MHHQRCNGYAGIGHCASRQQGSAATYSSSQRGYTTVELSLSKTRPLPHSSHHAKQATCTIAQLSLTMLRSTHVATMLMHQRHSIRQICCSQ